MTLPWPELRSTHRPDTIRQILDYLCWCSALLLEVGAKAGPDREAWRGRVQRAYSALFVPPLPGRGDPYPHDIPPARNPGIWPDIPSAGVPGMTLRHQLTVLGLVSERLRRDSWPNARPVDVAELDRRLSLARTHLDQGPAIPMPEEVRSKPSAAVIEDAEARARAVRQATRKRIRLAEAALAAAKRRRGAKGSKKPAKPRAKKRPR